MTPIEALILSGIIILLARSIGWNFKVFKEENAKIIYHPNPDSPSGGFFEIPTNIDPKELKKLFEGMGDKMPPSVPQNKAPSGSYL